MALIPLLHGLHGGFAFQRRLWQLVVVQGYIAHQRLLQVLGAAKAMGLEHIGNTSIEALDHAVGSRCSGLGQPMLDAQLYAQLVELMVATGLTLTAGNLLPTKDVQKRYTQTFLKN